VGGVGCIRWGAGWWEGLVATCLGAFAKMQFPLLRTKIKGSLRALAQSIQTRALYDLDAVD
jgi:hypothetical protein